MRTEGLNLGRRQLIGAAAALLAAGPAASGPGETQDEAPSFGTVDVDAVDAQRARAVPLRLYWPTRRASDAAVPLIVFSHGIGGSRRGYSYLGRHWAAQGWASLHVQHVGSDSTLWRGNPFGVFGRLRDAAQEHEAVDRVKDLHFALDALQAMPMGAGIDPSRIVVAGHSYGANTALLALGARVARGDRWLQFRDPRFAAGVIISAPPFYGEHDLAAVLSPVSVPTLHVTATQDVIQIPGYHSDAADRLAVFDAVADPRKLLVVYEGGSHSMFTDRGVTGGVTLNPQVKTATKELTLAFFRHTFDHDVSALVSWLAQWQGLLAPEASLRLAGTAG